MERALSLLVFQGGVQEWVLDPRFVQRVLSDFDEEVVLEKLALSSSIVMVIIWPKGEGVPFWDSSMDTMDVTIDAKGGLVSLPLMKVQWPLPEGFVELLFTSVSDLTPTPSPVPPRPTLLPSPTLTPTIVPPRSVFFDHPEGELRWDGPDDRIYTLGRGHCEPPREIREDFGIPALIRLDDEVWFWFWRVLPREEGWGWTGYSHGDWQLWQGDDGWKVYLVHAQEPGAAFEYRFFLCS
jgi:hypothetical protein